MVRSVRRVEGFTAGSQMQGETTMGEELIVGLICLIVAFVVVAGIFLSPFLTFLLLFTTLGNVVHRALRGKPLRTAYRFDLRALIVLITFTALSIGWLKASYDRDPRDRYGRDFGHVDYRSPRVTWGNHDPWVYVANWLVIAVPVSMLLALARYAIDLYDDRRRPLHSPTKAPPSFEGISPSAPASADISQDSPQPGE